MSASDTARRTRADVGPCRARAAISSEMSSICDVEPGCVLAEPAQARIRGRPAEGLLAQSRHRAVVDHFAVLVAPRRVEHLPDRHPRDVSGDDPIDELGRVAPGHEVLEQRRHVDQRRGVADGVVFVLVVALVGADRVVTGPLAVFRLSHSGRVRSWTAVPIGMADHVTGRRPLSIARLDSARAAAEEWRSLMRAAVHLVVHRLLLGNQTRAAGLS